MKRGYLTVFSLSLGLLVCDVRCAGSRAKIRFDRLEYPVSTSAYVAVGNKVVVRDEKTTVKSEVVVTKRFWGILYSFVRLSDGDELIEKLNQEIRLHGGRAVVNFTVESEACAMNSVIILSLLPFYPGCTIVTFRGEVVDR